MPLIIHLLHQQKDDHWADPMSHELHMSRAVSSIGPMIILALVQGRKDQVHVAMSRAVSSVDPMILRLPVQGRYDRCMWEPPAISNTLVLASHTVA